MYYDYGMSPVNEVTGKKEVYSEQSDNPNSTATVSDRNVPVGKQGMYYSEDTQQSSGVVNIYGSDIANFAKFKGNDKYDAMEMTNDVATYVKMAYIELLHKLKEVQRTDPNFEDVELTFEPMPDPQTCGKGRDGFNTYKQQLNNWKNMAMKQIENADDELERYKHYQKIDENTSKIIAATFATGAEVRNAIADSTEDIINNNDQNAADIETAVHNEGVRTRGTVRQEGETTRDAVTADGITTRKTVKKEAESTRGEIQKEADRIIDTLDPAGFSQAVKKIRDAAKAAGKSIVDFIRENPALPFVAGLPLGAAVLVPKVRDALGL